MTARFVGLALSVAVCFTSAACSTPTGGAQPWSAATVVAAPADLPDDPAAVALLRAADAAAKAVSFDVVIEQVAGNGDRSVIRVQHVPGQGSVMTPVDDPNATRLFPDERVSPSLLGALAHLDVLVRRFAVVLGESGLEGSAVGDRVTDLVEARDVRGDVAARFWVDRKSGFLVQREVTDSDTGQVRRASLMRLVMNARMAPSAEATTSTPLDDVAVERLRSEGWTCPKGLPGGLELAAAMESSDGAVHLVYVDGVEQVSLFVQRGQLDPTALPHLTRETRSGGMVLTSLTDSPTWVWQSAGSVFTVMTDAPKSMVERIIAALPPDSE